MLESIIKKFPKLIIAALIATFAVSAQDDKSTTTKLYDQGHAVQENQMLGAYNAPARIDVRNCWDFFITGSYIWWEAKEQGLEIGRFVTSDANLYQGEIINHDSGYNSGFKAGLGWNTDFDDWQIYVEYTRLHSSSGKNYTAPLYAGTLPIYPVWLNDATIPIANTHSKWRSNIDLIDLEFARPCYQGTKLTFRPHMGLRGGWIGQNFNVNYIHTGADDWSKNKSKSWLVGPRLGLDTNWIFGAGFRMFADFATSLFYQKYTTLKLTQQNTANAALAQNLNNNNKSAINPYVECGLGLGWGTYFDNSNWHFDLSAGYEFHNFWNQNEMRGLNDSLNARTDGAPGSLALHGLTITARLDF